MTEVWVKLYCCDEIEVSKYRQSKKVRQIAYGWQKNEGE